MYDDSKLEELRQALERWEETSLQQTLARTPEQQVRFIPTPYRKGGRLRARLLALPGADPPAFHHGCIPVSWALEHPERSEAQSKERPRFGNRASTALRSAQRDCLPSNANFLGMHPFITRRVEFGWRHVYNPLNGQSLRSRLLAEVSTCPHPRSE